MKNSKLFLVSSKYDFVNFAEHLNSFHLINNNANESIVINPIKNLLLINNLKVFQDKISIEISRLGENNFIQKFQLKANTLKDGVIYSQDHIIKEGENKVIVKLKFPIEIIFRKVQ